MIRPLLIALALACGAASAQDAALPNASVQSLDLQRYAGQWHEIARLPMFFQRNCAANVTATYTPRADGKVGVRNACDDKDGESMVSEGVARPVAGQPGQLEVRFAPDWLAWAPMTWADYWVVELDPDYQWPWWAGRAASICGCCRARRRCRARSSTRSASARHDAATRSTACWCRPTAWAMADRCMMMRSESGVAHAR